MIFPKNVRKAYLRSPQVGLESIRSRRKRGNAAAGARKLLLKRDEGDRRRRTTRAGDRGADGYLQQKWDALKWAPREANRIGYVYTLRDCDIRSKKPVWSYDGQGVRLLVLLLFLNVVRSVERHCGCVLCLSRVKSCLLNCVFPA